MTNLFYVYFENWIISIEINLLVLIIIFVLVIIICMISRKRINRHKYDLVKLNISLGSIGEAEFRPSIQDIQIAHRIWTELVTRKAAVPIDTENDVITEIYDSWYELFSRIRLLICDIPGDLVRRDESTQEIVRIATETLNKGLRPHLTKWQSRFRNWCDQNREKLIKFSPQEFQRQYPDYDLLVEDLKRVNNELIQYAEELQKIILGKN